VHCFPLARSAPRVYTATVSENSVLWRHYPDIFSFEATHASCAFVSEQDVGNVQTCGSKINMGRSAGLIVFGNSDTGSSLSMLKVDGTSAAGPAENSCARLHGFFVRCIFAVRATKVMTHTLVMRP